MGEVRNGNAMVSRKQSAVISRRSLLGGVSALMLLAPRMSLAQSKVAASARANTLSLNGAWRFALAPSSADAAAFAGFQEAGFDAARFTQIPVPSNWAVLGFEEPQYRDFKERTASEGFYLRQFDVPAGWKGSRILLHFNGVWASAEVWLNGKRLGQHDSGFTSFAYEVSDELASGKPNTLAVRVRQMHPEYLFDTNDDWALGGIFGDVWLETMPGKRWLDTVQIETTFDDQFEDADLNVRVMVGDTHKSTVPGNYMSTGQVPYDLAFTLLDREGREVLQRTITVPAHFATSRETRLSAGLARPRQWNAETPYLYTLHVDLLEAGQPVHRRTEKVGFRQISTKGGMFRINGQAVKLRGVNRHEEHPDVGRATNRQHWLEDLTLMKAANINYVRCAHYPPASGFLDLCDEMGMYVGDEVPMNGGEMNNPSSAEGAMLRTYEAVSRDINHPSVIYWSIGNEDPLTSLHLAAVRAAKGMDPTRPVLLPWRADDWLPPEIDILAPHYWHPEEYDALAGRATRPIITTEYTHAYGPDGLGSLKARWEALTKHPAGAGAAIWMWADQGLKTKGEAAGISRQPGLRLTEEGWDGITDAYRRPTRDYWETKAVYAQAYPAIDQIDFVPGQTAVQVPIQNDFDFTDLAQVKIDWQILEDDRQLASGTGSIAGQPHAAALFALPVQSIRQVRPGSTYYAWFTFRDAQGGEITRRAVELRNREAASAATSLDTVTVETGETVAIKVGAAEYRFSPATGALVSASLSGRPVIAGLSPSLWRRLDDNERYVAGAKGEKYPDLNRARPTVRTWDVRTEAGAAIVSAVVDYVVDANNRYTATYHYVVGRDGRLQVQYAFEPTVEAPWLPQVGMVLRTAAAPDRLRWLGLGPLDAYPNKQAAPILGVWGGKPGQETVTGVKKTRWVELGNAGARARVANDGYLYSEAGAPDTVHLLSGVLGRPEKGRQPQEPVPQLTTGKGARFAGEFSIALSDGGA